MVTIANAIGAGVGAAVQGGITAIAYDQDPLDAMLKNGLTAGVSSALQSTIDNKLKDVPGFKSTNDPLELTFQRALKSAVAAGITGGDVGESVKLSLLTSAGETLGTYVKNNIKDLSGPLTQSSKDLTKSYTDLENNLAEQQYYANQYNELSSVIKPYQDRAQEAANDTNKWISIFENMQGNGFTGQEFKNVMRENGYMYNVLLHILMVKQ
jgi:hypothetical protein